MRQNPWKKLHIVTTEDGKIITNSMTAHNKDDRSQVGTLLTGIKAKELLADSGYDGENIYQPLRAKGMKLTIRPPNKPAVNGASQRSHLSTRKGISTLESQE